MDSCTASAVPDRRSDIPSDTRPAPKLGASHFADQALIRDGARLAGGPPHVSRKDECAMIDRDDLRTILDLLRALARGDNPGLGRDEVAGLVHVETGGMRGRMLACASTMADGAYHVSTSGGEIAIRLTAKGELIFPCGAVEITAIDRTRGAAFVDAVAEWLGTPLAPAASIAADVAVTPIAGDYARLAIRDDADGIRWHAHKLMLDVDEGPELFLRISADHSKAVFTEKWSAYHESLLVQLDRRLGMGRAIAPRKHVDVMRGASITIPPDWIVTERVGELSITDATDEASLGISHQPFPLDPRLPGLRARLEAAVSNTRCDASTAILTDRGDLELAWCEYPYEATDTKTGEKRLARSRVLIAANDVLQVLVTFAYWPADASWAVPEWQRIVSSLRLASRLPFPPT